MSVVTAPSRVRTRLATAHDGPLIHDLLHRAQHQWKDLVTWDDSVAAHWIVAETDVPVGAVMLAYGKPIGIIECMVVDPTLPQTTKGRVVRALSYMALAALKRYGSEIAMFYLTHGLLSWHRILEKRGAVGMNTVNSYLKRL